MRHNQTYGIMRRLMAEDGRVSGSIAKRLEVRHLNIVHDRRVVGLVAAMADHRADIAEEAIGALNSLDGIPHLYRPGIIGVRQTIDLLNIEHRVCLQERDFPIDIVAAPVGHRLGEPTGEDDRRARFALAHGAAQFQGLLEGHPHR